MALQIDFLEGFLVYFVIFKPLVAQANLVLKQHPLLRMLLVSNCYRECWEGHGSSLKLTKILKLVETFKLTRTSGTTGTFTETSKLAETSKLPNLLKTTMWLAKLQWTWNCIV